MSGSDFNAAYIKDREFQILFDQWEHWEKWLAIIRFKPISLTELVRLAQINRPVSLIKLAAHEKAVMHARRFFEQSIEPKN